MRIFENKIILALAALFILPAAQAVAAPLTLTCSNNGSATLTVPVISAFLDVGQGTSNFYFSVTTDIANLDELLFSYEKNYQYCNLSSDTKLYPETVALEALTANISPTGNYAQLTFSYARLVFNASAAPAARSATAVPLSADQKAKALAAFLARVPVPVIPATTTTTPAK